MDGNNYNLNYVQFSAENIQPPPPDTTTPTVSTSAPASGASVSGSSVIVAATASDNVGVVGVQFKLDGANLGSEDTSTPYSITWNTTSVTNGNHILTAIARDAAGNRGTSSPIMVSVNNAAPDTTPPVISAVSPSSIVSNSATISWMTDEVSDTQVEYGTTASYGSQTTLISALVTAHLQTISGLAPTTLYYYRVKSKDAARNLALSDAGTLPHWLFRCQLLPLTGNLTKIPGQRHLTLLATATPDN